MAGPPDDARDPSTSLGMTCLRCIYEMSSKKSLQFYFALPRLIAKVRGGDAQRAESNWLEAYVVSLAIYFVQYILFAAKLVPLINQCWLIAVLLVVLLFVVWLFWVLVLSINSLVIKLLHRGGMFRAIPIRRAQSILFGILTTAMAIALLTSGSSMRMIGFGWLAAVMLNLAAAVVLSFSNGTHIPEE